MIYPEVQVDIETLGLSPDLSPVIQIAAVRFNLEEMTIDTDNMFTVSMEPPPTRHADPATLDWWSRQQPGLLDSIMAQAVPAEQGIKSFWDWSVKVPGCRFWSKPLSCDYSFISSYFREFGLLQPYHYRTSNDMNSFLRGMYWPSDVPKVSIDLELTAHNALDDCIYQIATLFKHKEVCLGQ